MSVLEEVLQPSGFPASGAAAPPEPGPVTISVDGITVQARPGTSLLAAARAAGVEVPTLCHHEAVESRGACRLCVVDITRDDWNSRSKMVVSCLYPVEPGLTVSTQTDGVRAVRREILDLLLARCPEAPVIQRLARAHGITRTTYRRNPVPTTCILCGLCTRVCDLVGCSAIAMVQRGIRREVAPPFGQPPPDCVGCLACAEVCPTGHIPFQTSEVARTIWGRRFAMLRCPACGRAHITVAQADFWAARTGMPRAYFESCEACKRIATAATMAGLAAAV
jgi:bidirectional [NiFe] hydrogenase diaphorase subunit